MKPVNKLYIITKQDLDSDEVEVVMVTVNLADAIVTLHLLAHDHQEEGKGVRLGLNKDGMRTLVIYSKDDRISDSDLLEYAIHSFNPVSPIFTP